MKANQKQAKYDKKDSQIESEDEEIKEKKDR